MNFRCYIWIYLPCLTMNRKVQLKWVSVICNLTFHIWYAYYQCIFNIIECIVFFIIATQYLNLFIFIAKYLLSKTILFYSLPHSFINTSIFFYSYISILLISFHSLSPSLSTLSSPSTSHLYLSNSIFPKILESQERKLTSKLPFTWRSPFLTLS